MKTIFFLAVGLICCLWETGASPKQLRKYRDCWELWNAGKRKAGVFVLYPNGTEPVKLYCNHTETNTATLIQQRTDASVSFNRYLHDYQVGFGNTAGNYWAGLETISALTSRPGRGLHIRMTDWQGNIRSATYSHFMVQDRTQYYRLLIGGFSGTVPDDMAASNGMYFYTPDYKDAHDCAVNMHAGWWFNYCTHALPNGIYYYGGHYTPSGPYYDGIFWEHWMGFAYSLRFISMSVI